MKFEELHKNEEIAQRQRSRMLWLKGDNNTKFFHNSTNAYKRSNYIGHVEVEGKTVKERGRVKEEIVQLYKKLYTEMERLRPAGNMTDYPTISEEEKTQLQVYLCT